MADGDTNMKPHGSSTDKPIFEEITSEQAKYELENLKAKVGDMAAFEERAHRYELSPEEFAVWEEIDELRWLLGEGEGE